LGFYCVNVIRQAASIVEHHKRRHELNRSKATVTTQASNYYNEFVQNRRHEIQAWDYRLEKLRSMGEILFLGIKNLNMMFGMWILSFLYLDVKYFL
jgi:hypothetical protein